MKRLISSLSFLALAAGPLAVHAQEESINYIRDYLAFRVSGDFAPNPNGIEVFNNYCIDFQSNPDALGDCTVTSPYGLDYEDFIALLETAYAEGRGGVIDFENPIFGPVFRDFDKRGYRAFIEDFINDNPQDAFDAQIRQENPGLSDADLNVLGAALQKRTARAAAEAALLDTSFRIPVENRQDMGRDDTLPNAITEDLRFNSLIALYGPNGSVPLRIRFGEMSYTEQPGQTGTENYPGSFDVSNLRNGSSFPSVGISLYASSRYRPVSGLNSINQGMHDFRFDPRDNVKVIGLAFLTFDNFQYYQGASGIPTNPNNMRLWVEFSNGEQEEFAQTSQQSGGNWDVFFAVQAPEGASIVRAWTRVIGINSRTSVSLDDLTFITEPAPSYIAGETVFTGTQGAEFYALLEIGQSPQSVSVSGLPAGLSYDAETRLIQGQFSESGSFTATVTMVNSVGTSTENLTFEVSPASDPASNLQLDPVGDVLIILRRDLPETSITYNLQESLPPNAIQFFSRVERILEDGSRVELSLDFLGLSLRDNVLFGTPRSARQIGSYEVTIYARAEGSSSKVTFPLTILSPTRQPNFDGNATTDLGYISGDKLMVSYRGESPGTFTGTPFAAAFSGISASADVFMADLSGDTQIDFLAFDAAAGEVKAYIQGEESMGYTSNVLLSGMSSSAGESIVAIVDLDGDATADILWDNPSRDRISVWLMRGGKPRWAGLDSRAGGLGELIAAADFAGDGRNVLFTRTGPGSYKLEQMTVFNSVGGIQSESIEFTLDSIWQPLLFEDFNNDGGTDILWLNSTDGTVMIWPMQGISSRTSYFAKAPLSSEDSTLVPVVDAQGRLQGIPGISPFSQPFDWKVMMALDLNDDQNADLILRNTQGGGLGLLLLKAGIPSGDIHQFGGAAYSILSAGDFDGNRRNDLLLLDADSNRLLVATFSTSSEMVVRSLGDAPSGATWLTDSYVDNSPGQTGDGLDWIGPYTFPTPSLAYAYGWGWTGTTAWSFGYIYDPVMGWLYTNADIWPFIYHQRRNEWLYFFEGTSAPRLFYNYRFRRPLPETVLR